MYYANHLRLQDISIPSTSDDDVDDVEEDKEVDRNVVRNLKFYQIREEVRAILGIINRRDNPPNDQIKLLCERIINTDNE